MEMQAQFDDILAAWIGADYNNDIGFRNLKEKIDYLSEVLYKEYRPTMAGPHQEFRFRLAKWICSAKTEQERSTMFLLLDHLFFLGKKDCDSLYLTAFSRHIVNWIISSEKISIFAPDAEVKVRQSLARTAFTAITDSFNLNDFIHLNGIQGADPRFQWKQALELGFDPAVFERTVLNCKNRLVLLEDFVGSGSQMSSSVAAACSLPSRPSVLLCPLIICPAGADLAKKLTIQFSNLTYMPVLELPPSAFLSRTASQDEPRIFSLARQLVQDLHPLVKGTDNWLQDYGAFGFGHTGGLIVKYDNCPDNSLPILHHASNSPWEPLFLRVSRLV